MNREGSVLEQSVSPLMKISGFATGEISLSVIYFDPKLFDNGHFRSISVSLTN